MRLLPRLAARRTKRNSRGRSPSPRRPYPRPFRPTLEHLEDRTLLSVGYSNVPTAMDNFLTALQSDVNDQLFPGTGIGLPLVGAALSNTLPQTQFLNGNQQTPPGIEQDLDSAFKNKTLTSFMDVKNGFMTAAQNSQTKWSINFASVIGDVNANNPDDPANTKVTFQSVITEAAQISSLDFASGLTGLHLNLDKSGINLILNYTFNLNFIVDNSGGQNDVLLDTTPQTLISANAVASIANFGGTLTLGPFDLTVYDGSLPAPWITTGTPAKSNLNATFALSVANQGQLSYTDANLANDLNSNSLLNLTSTEAVIDLGIVLAIKDQNNNQTFPSVAANLAVDWPFTGDKAGTIPSVSFNDVQLDIGSFFSDFVGPIISKLQQVTKPLQPIVDVLQKDIPVLNDLSELAGKGEVNLEKLIDSQLQNTTLQTFDNDVNFINSFNLGSGGNTAIQLGSFKLTDANSNPLDVRTLDMIKGIADGPSKLLNSITSQLQNDVPGLTIYHNLQSHSDPSNNPLFSFPILDDPQSAFNLLLGKTVDLFDCHLVKNQDWPLANFSDFYPIFGPVGIQISGNFDFQANFDFGYDTYGFTRPKINPLQGFFVVSDAQLNDEAYATVTGSLNAGPGINLVFASANINGGIDGTATIGLNSPVNGTHLPANPQASNISGDGRIRLQDVEADIAQFGVVGFLTGSGEVDASLNFHAQVGFGPLGASYDKVLAKKVLLDFNFNTAKDVPILAGAGTAYLDKNIKDNNSIYLFSNGNGGQLILNMGPYAHYRNNSADGDEDFNVTFIKPDPNNANAEWVEVSAFGLQQEYEGVTSILAEGGLGNNTITIDPAVMVPVQLYASVWDKDPNFGGFSVDEQAFMTKPEFQKSHNVLQAGGSDATLTGGQGVDDLIGGYGKNTIKGGDAQAGTQNNERLVGGNQNTSFNTLTAGNGGDNLLIAGPNGDVLTGGKSSGNNDIFVAGTGNDSMTGGAGANLVEWQGADNYNHPTDGNTIIAGGPAGSTNTLQVAALQAGDLFEADASGPNLIVYTPVLQVPPGHMIQATGIQTLTMDDGYGGASYTVNDLAGTGIQQVNLNLSEVGNAIGGPDQITVNGSKTAVNTVDVSANPNVLAGNAYDANGKPLPQVYGQATNIDLNIAGGDFAGSPGASYVVTAAIPKNSDMLSINTGNANDTVSVESTQSAVSVNSDPGNSRPPILSGSVFVNTIGGNNTINVGTANPGQGLGLLDRIQGNLYIDAGTGTQNQLNVDEGYAVNGDTLALTANHVFNGGKSNQVFYQIQRYLGEDLSMNPDGGGAPNPGSTQPPPPPEPQRYAMLIQYSVETGGAYGAGVNLYLTRNTDKLYVTDTMTGAPTTIYSDGNMKSNNPFGPDTIVVGYNPLDLNPTNSDGIPRTPQDSFLDNLKGPLDVEGTDGAKNAIGDVDLQLFDEAAATEQYQITASQVARVGILPITCHDLGIPNFPGMLELFASNSVNTIGVGSTAKDTTTKVYTGMGGSSIQVGKLLFPPPFPPLYSLDSIQGALTINGGGGTDNLTINDNANNLGYSYNLTATTMQRFGFVAIAPIVYSQMTTMDLFEADPQSNTTSVSGTSAGTISTIHTGDGNDGLNVSTLDQVQGPLNFVWSSGLKSLVVDDTSAMGANTYTVDSLELDRTGAAKIQYDRLNQLKVFLPLGPATIVDIPSIAFGTGEAFVAGNGDTLIYVAGPGDVLDNIQGSLSVQGGGNTTMYLEDQNSGVSRGYDFEVDHVQSRNIGAIQYTNLSGLVLDASTFGSNNIGIDATASGTQMTVNAGTNDQVQVGFANFTLQNIQGPLDVVGTAAGVSLELIDSSGNPLSLYKITATELDHVPSAAIQYQGLSQLNLIGSSDGDVYNVQSFPAQTSIEIGASGVQNLLEGPDMDNTWQFQRVGQLVRYLLDGNINFIGIQNLRGGSSADDFQFLGIGYLGSIDGGSGTNTLDFSQLGGPVSVTLNQDGATDGVNGTASALSGNFSNIDSLIGSSPGSTLDGSSYSGNFTHTLTVSGFDNMNLQVPGNFSGSLLASSEGTPGLPVKIISIGGTMGTNAVIKTNFLQTFNVLGNMGGVLKGFGIVNGQVDGSDITIQTITISGTFGSSADIIAPVLAQADINQYTGHIQETEPNKDMQLLKITGSLAATGTVEAGSIADLEVGQDLAGSVEVSGPIGTLNVVQKLTGSVTAGSIGSAFIGDFTATGSVQAGSIFYLQVFEQTVTPGEDPNLDGNVSVSGPITTLRVDKNLSGSVTAASIGSGFVGGDFTGRIVVGSMGSFTVLGANLGTINASPTLTTQASAGGLLGTVTLTDTATLSGGFSVNGGTITFTLTAPDNSTMTETVAVTNGDNTYTTPTGIAATMPGVYMWSARYSGNSTNNPATDNGQNESTTVTSFSISGSVYDDLTENGFSSDDPKLSTADPNYVPVTVNLYQNSGTTPFATTTTNAIGDYSFTGLGAGSYSVSEVGPAGWKETANSMPATAGHSGTASVGPSALGSVKATGGGSSTQNDFDNFKYGQITGTVFHDITGNGWSADDTPLNIFTGPAAFLLYQNGARKSVTIQNTGGMYSFSHLDYGTYEVVEITLPTWVLTANSTPGEPLSHTGAATTGPSGTGAVVVTSGLKSTGNDFDNAHVYQSDMTAAFGTGFWRKHAALITGGDLQFLSALYLRNPNGSRFSFPYTNFATFTKSQLAADQSALANFLGNTTLVNPASMLSAQLVAMELNVRWGSTPAAGDVNLTGLSANAVIYDPGLAKYAASTQMTGLYNGGFITVGNLMATANSELALYGIPAIGSFDFNFENELSIAITLANLNLDFVI